MSARDRIAGEPMDPAATPGEPLPSLPGCPFGYPGASVLIVGPTGRGRSSLVEAMLYDAALAGASGAYLGSEVGREEFNARAADIAKRRGDHADQELRGRLANCRYLDLADVIPWARTEPTEWTELIAERYVSIAIDPLSAVASCLGADFDSNRDYCEFYDRLILPLIQRGVGVVLVDNVGHSEEAKARAKGASAKQDRADVTISCALSANPPGLIVKAGKVRSVRAPFRRGDEWLFTKDTQRIVAREHSGEEPASTFRPTEAMEKASIAVEQDPGLTKRALRTALGVRHATVDLALELLIAEGFLTAEVVGRATKHYSAKPYREAMRPTCPTVPERAPGTPDDNVPHVPRSLRPGTDTGTIDGHIENGDRAHDPEGSLSESDYVAEFRRRTEQGLV